MGQRQQVEQGTWGDAAVAVHGSLGGVPLLQKQGQGFFLSARQCFGGVEFMHIAVVSLVQVPGHDASKPRGQADA